MFWGVTLENDKRYTQTVEASFHLSMAALDPNPPSTADVSKTSAVSLWLQHDKAEFLLCTLEYGKLYQQPLDCNFTEGEEVTFFLNGQGVIHLTGYLIEDMSMADESMVEPMVSSSEDDDDDDDDSDESEDIPVLVDAKQFAKGAKKRTKEMKAGTQKKIKVEGEDKDSDESSSEYSETGEDDDDDDEDEDEDVEEDESSEDDSTEDSDDSDTNKITSKKALKAKSENGKKNNPNSCKQKPAKAIKEQKLSKKLKNKEKKNVAISMPTAEEEESIDKAFLDTSMASEKKKKKKKKKPAKTSEASNSSTSNNKQDLGTSSEDSKNTSRVLASGLVIEDTQVGQGAEARIGRQVHVYYSGKLAKNGKKFDSCSSGKPFRFALGRGEVITGWDKGLVGMRVGGKRKLTIPAKLGYGNQQAGPIPPNSSLVFEIELKAVS